MSIATESVVETEKAYKRSFLKWAGGKFSLLGELSKLIPAGDRLIEPFVGGGSVFLNSTKHDRFILGDVNEDLIKIYQNFAAKHDEVISAAKVMFLFLNSEKNYYSVRDEFNDRSLDDVYHAAAFLYLNRHGFNGLVRYNKSGQFNIPWGRYTSPYFPDDEIQSFISLADKCVFMHADFGETIALAGVGDVVYCDPPYEPLPARLGFTSYAAGGFSFDDQHALTESCIAAHQRGASIVISNSSAPRIIDLYTQHGFTIHHVEARRSISSKGSTRERAKDIVAVLEAGK